MALILLPFFMPLMLIGWIFPPEHEREADEEQAERERQFGRTWAQLFGWEGEPEAEQVLAGGPQEGSASEPTAGTGC